MKSALGQVVQNLCSVWSALPALSGIPVYNGPPMSDQVVTTLVAVNDDADPDSTEESTVRWEWLDFAHTRRREDGEVIGVVIVSSGSLDLAASENTCFEILGDCEQAIRSDPTIGGVVQSSELVSGTAQTLQNANGSAIVVPFIVAYFAIV
jgi:hypothetical protein